MSSQAPTSIVPNQIVLSDIESNLIVIDNIVKVLNVPRDVLANDEEIRRVWRDLPDDLSRIPVEKRDALIARLCVAVSVGLFDGAINYVWNASILSLRNRVRFFGLNIVASLKQSSFEEKDLINMTDAKLLELCLTLSLLSEEAYFYLDQCRSMRNNFSAAHPAVGGLNNREFLVFLDRCIRFALVEIASPKGVDVARFIGSIKGIDRLNSEQKDFWTSSILATYDEQKRLLVGTMHGIYCDPSVTEIVRLNCLDVCEGLREHVSESVYSKALEQHNEYLVKDVSKKLASDAFFDKLSLIGLLGEQEKHVFFLKAIERLLNAHNATDNFYNEPPFAERLLELSRQYQIPATVRDFFVDTVVGCYMGNSYGYSWEAEAFYIELIKGFSPAEVAAMVRLPLYGLSYRLIRGKVSDTSCKIRLKKALRLIDEQTIDGTVKLDYDKVFEL